jgi:N-acetylmuramoyl-L-alanine amidase
MQGTDVPPRRASRLPAAAAMLATACLAALAGCNPPTPKIGNDDEFMTPSRGGTNVAVLAQRLGLTVVSDTPSAAVLRNQANVVQLPAGPGFRAVVNGRMVGPPGGSNRIRGVLYVSEDVESAVRGALRPVSSSPPPPPPPVAVRRRTIVVDPGHGGPAPGAISVTGVREKDIVLPMAMEVARLLREAGHTVIMTRSGDTSLTRGNDTSDELDARANLANRNNADILVSIHADSAANREARGFTVYLDERSGAASLAAANSVNRSMTAGSGLDSRGVRREKLRILRSTQGPGILIEIGYLSNCTEATLLAQNATQRRLAQSIVAGLTNWFAGLR